MLLILRILSVSLERSQKVGEPFLLIPRTGSVGCNEKPRTICLLQQLVKKINIGRRHNESAACFRSNRKATEQKRTTWTDGRRRRKQRSQPNGSMAVNQKSGSNKELVEVKTKLTQSTVALRKKANRRKGNGRSRSMARQGGRVARGAPSRVVSTTAATWAPYRRTTPLFLG